MTDTKGSTVELHVVNTVSASLIHIALEIAEAVFVELARHGRLAPELIVDDVARQRTKVEIGDAAIKRLADVLIAGSVGAEWRVDRRAEGDPVGLEHMKSKTEA